MALTQTNTIDTFWQPHRVKRLKELWTAGKSNGEIAKLMGISRNAATGKTTRMVASGALPARMSKGPAVKRIRHRGLSHSLPVERVAKPAPEPVEAALHDGAHLTVMTISARACHWPIGDPAAAGFHFCGHPRDGKSSYCEAHHRKAVQPQPQRHEQSA